jgi:peptidoglycan/LPS O-acetylase OafA/YrhL
MRPLFLFDLALGIALIATIASAARRPPIATETRCRRLLGWVLVLIPLPLVVACRLVVPTSEAASEGAFVLAVVAFGVGAMLILARDDGEDDGRADADPAPWWPEFEQQFRAYARRQSRPRVRI